jgi:hypothetical protein
MKLSSPTGRKNRGRALKRLLDTWDRNGSESDPTLWQIDNDDDDVPCIFYSFLSKLINTHQTNITVTSTYGLYLQPQIQTDYTTDCKPKKVIFNSIVKSYNIVTCQYFYRTVIPTATVSTDINWRWNSLIYRLCFEQLQFEECVWLSEVLVVNCVVWLDSVETCSVTDCTEKLLWYIYTVVVLVVNCVVVTGQCRNM